MKDQSVAVSTAASGNLLKNKFIGWVFTSGWYPGFFQWLTVLVFLLIMYLLLLGPTSAHDNWGTALTWVLWWPLIPIIFVLAGRFWCNVCPFGKLNDVVQKLVGHNRPVPLFLKKYGIWIIDAVFIMITWGDHVFGMVESPWNSGVLMLMIATAVVATGVFWERRSWCRHLCFLGGLSSNYSQTGMLALRGTSEKCAECKVPYCYKGWEKVPGCPVFEYPRTMNSNAQCNFCGHCVKSCPNDSLTLKVRLPTSELWFVHKPQFAAAFLAAVIMGIVFLQNFTMLEAWKPMLSWLENAFNTDSFMVTFTVVFLITLPIPLALLAFTSFVAQKFNGDSLVKNFTRFGYAIIPLDVAGHIAHNLFHLLAEGKAVFLTGLAFFGKEVPDVSNALVDGATIQILQYALIALGVAGSLFTVYRISKSNYTGGKTWATVIPYAVLLILFGIVNIALFSLPMMMRL